MPGPWSCEMELPAEASSVFRARAFVAGVLLRHALDHLVDDIGLATSELATNAVLHARTRFTVVVSAFDETVFLEVLDRSPTGPKVVRSRTSDTNGRGMLVVQAISRDWGVIAREPDGKTVWAAFNASPVVPI